MCLKCTADLEKKFNQMCIIERPESTMIKVHHKSTLSIYLVLSKRIIEAFNKYTVA
jgi:hypothetical protein